MKQDELIEAKVVGPSELVLSFLASGHLNQPFKGVSTICAVTH